MTSLQETLPALSASVPEVAALTAALIKEGDAVEQAAKELLQQLENKREEAAELFGQVQEALGDLVAAAEGDQAELESGAGELETGIDDFRKGLDESHEELRQVVDQAAQAMTELQGALASGAAATRAVHDDYGEAFGRVDEALRGGQEQLGDMLDALAAEGGALQQVVQEAKTAVTGGMAALRDQMQAFLEAGRGEVENTAQTLRSLLATHQGHLQEQGARLDQGQKELLDDLRDRVEEELKSRIAAAAGRAADSLDELSQTAAQAIQLAKAAREELDARFRALAETMDPLPAAIESVKQAAQEVGLAWG